MMESSRKTLQMPALGRPFKLGMLYDCREDCIVPGITLWDPEHLKQDTGVQNKPNNEFEIVASESIEDKSSALNVEASLKASFLSGLVEVEGSAHYLNDQKTSKNQARVTLKYNATTRFEELSMKHLGRGNVKHSDVFEKGIATHVVTGILYGAQAFFVFDREISKSESQQVVHGNLQAMIKKIPSFSIEGKGDLKMDDKDRADVDKFSCKFYGDFNLEKSPVAFPDAVEVYQSLPKLLGAKGENAVPVKVWLLPLTALDSAAAKVVREISVRLVNEAQSVLEDFYDLELRCKDALKTTTVQIFPQIGKKIKSFKNYCNEFRLEFQKLLAKKLPLIRGGGEEEAGLVDILKKRTSSPFNSSLLSDWIEYKEREIGILKSYTKMMKNPTVVQRKQLEEEIINTERTVCFVFTSLGAKEPYLESLEKYLKEGKDSCASHELEEEQWFTSRDVANATWHKAKLFSDFAEANRENESIKFLIMALTDENHKGTSVYLYEAGSFPNVNFEPTSKPEDITVTDIDYNAATLKISPPAFGTQNVTSYCVEFSVIGEEQWRRVSDLGADSVALRDLEPNTEYAVRCRAVTKAGFSPAREAEKPVKTLPCSAPEKLQVKVNSSEMSVKWEKPARFGKHAEISGYVVEFAQINNEQDLKWNQKYLTDQRAIISGLQSETKYAVRVHSDCGISGRSKNSEEVHVTTKKHQDSNMAAMMNSLFVKAKSSLLQSSTGSLPVYQVPLEEEHINISGCRRFTFGKDSVKTNRTIMVLGGKGAGKSTLIDGMINYILGVRWEDDYRFQLVREVQKETQAVSQTSEVTVYKLNHQDGFQIDFSLTIIDTPGFGDTTGIENDRKITEMIRNLFTSESGVLELDAVCFVVQAALARLTPSQRYVFDSVLSIFGKDIKENIRVLVTFADGKRPPVLEAIGASGVPCPEDKGGAPLHFKFNNSALFSDSNSQTRDEEEEEDEEDFDEMFWKMGQKSMKRFFVALNKITTKSLTLTKEVLTERKQLENLMESLQKQVRVGLSKLEEIKETRAIIQTHEAEMKRNDNFEIEVKVTKPLQIENRSGTFFTNCQQCHYTCHDDCIYGNDADKRKCPAMGPDGHCTVCPGKCIWTVHFNQKYKWDFKEVTEKVTVQELKDKFNIAKGEKTAAELLLSKLEDEYNEVHDAVTVMIDESSPSLKRLREIALKPDPLSDYVDMLIEGEKSEARPGWKNRVESLMGIKKFKLTEK